MREKALLVSAVFSARRRDMWIDDQAKELDELSASAGLVVMAHEIARQKEATPAYLIGKGKAEEIRALALKHRVDVVVMNSDLSGTQQRNLEEILEVKTIDRTQLILDIFAQRAKSMEGKIQVELAQLKYLLPRLSGKGVTLSRLGGGVGTRGPGEQKLEVDRRRIRERIARLDQELRDLKKRRITNIEKKKEKELPLITLVGYTNAGKSSLFNALTQSAVLVKDKLFSTLDTTTRLLVLPGNRKALLSDTVGFIRDLPHGLIESFKATLEETIYADLLVHVIDASRENQDSLKKAVDAVLSDLGVLNKKIVIALNKTDLLDEAKKTSLLSLRSSGEDTMILVSAKSGEGLDLLAQSLITKLVPERHTRTFFIPKEKLRLLNLLYEEADVIDRKDQIDGVLLQVRLSKKLEGLLDRKLKNA